MRSIALLSILLLATPAAAGPLGGGNKGGGGALGRVSSGIGRATRGAAPTPQPSSGDRSDTYDDNCYDYEGQTIECPPGTRPGAQVVVRRRAQPLSVTQGPEAKAAFYIGAQKVQDSDGSASVELAISAERFRITGAYSRYFERLQGGGVLSMSMPTLLAGIRLDDMGATQVFLEGGVVHARTSGDPMGDSKITGPIAGMHVEHAFTKRLSLIGDVQQMWFDNDIRATAGRVGVRYYYLQAGFRVLDFNVGPPLYGPEVGVAF